MYLKRFCTLPCEYYYSIAEIAEIVFIIIVVVVVVVVY